MSAAEGQEVAQMTIPHLDSLCNDAYFASLWQKLNLFTDKRNTSEPKLPRTRKAPRRLDNGLPPPEFPSSVDDHFHQIYSEAIDNGIGGLKDRFKQSGYATYSHLELHLIKACQGDSFTDELDFCCSFTGILRGHILKLNYAH